MRPLYIFDLDGTLALTDHRQHILDDASNPHRWRDFFAACVHDQPNAPVIRTLQTLRDADAEVWIWSGRSDEVRKKTERWLDAHVFDDFPMRATDVSFRMRDEGDFTPDDELKMRWLAEIAPHDRERLVAIFDDRDKVVAAWRAAGVPCFQVARGDF